MDSIVENNTIENSTAANNITATENKKPITINNTLMTTNSDIIGKIEPSQTDNSLFYPITNNDRNYNNCS